MQDQNIKKNKLRNRRVTRVRGRVSGSATKPRLAVFKSSKHLMVQAIDDSQSKTLVGLTDQEVKGKDKKIKAKEMGLVLAKVLLTKKIDQAVFDKRHYKYHGLIKELADGLRAGGIKF